MGGFANQNWSLMGAAQQGQSLGSILTSLFGEIGIQGAYTTSGPDEDGWFDYIGHQPPERALYQFKHDNILPTKIWTGYAYEFSPELNVAYLKWRLTGIAKEAGFNEGSLG